MSDMKTVPTDSDVEKFLAAIENDQRRKDSLEILEIMKDITGEKAVMWGPSIVGFGEYHYKYDSGREGDMFISGFSPRKQSLTVYVMPGFDRFEELMSKIGKHKTGKSCLYLKKLDDIDRSVLRELIDTSYKHMRKKYG